MAKLEELLRRLELREQGTIADLPIKASKKVYFVREENGAVADHGWITVDEARRKNSADRREFGSFQNRYFIDQGSADSYIDTVQRGATGFQEQPPGMPPEMPAGPEGELGPGLEEPAGPPPELPGAPPEGPADILGGPEEEEPDFAADLAEPEEPGELPPEEIDAGLPGPPEEEEIEFIVPRRVRLTTEAREKPPWERHPKATTDAKETRYCPSCKSEQTFIEDVCQHCNTYSAKPQSESLTEQQRRQAVMKCPKCGETWPVSYVYDTGKWWLENEDLAYCPECRAEGEQVEEVAAGRRPFESESTEDGIIEALLSGELGAREAIDALVEVCPPMVKAGARKKRGRHKR